MNVPKNVFYEVLWIAIRLWRNTIFMALYSLQAMGLSYIQSCLFSLHHVVFLLQYQSVYTSLFSICCHCMFLWSGGTALLVEWCASEVRTCTFVFSQCSTLRSLTDLHFACTREVVFELQWSYRVLSSDLIYNTKLSQSRSAMHWGCSACIYHEIDFVRPWQGLQCLLVHSWCLELVLVPSTYGNTGAFQ